MDNSKIKAAIAGEAVAPDVDFLRVIKDAGIVDAARHDDYNAYLSAAMAQGGESVYVSSRRFADNVSMEAVADDVVLAVLSGGQSVTGSTKALAEVFLLEWADLVSWLQGLGTEDAVAVATTIMSDVLQTVTGRESGANHAALQVGQVQYTYTVAPKEYAESIMRPLRLIGGKVPRQARVSVAHPVFTVTVEPRTAQTATEVAQQLRFRLANGPSLDVATALPDLSALGPLGAEVAAASTAVAEAWIRQVLSDALADGLGDLDEYHKGRLVFDLSSAPVARQFEERLQASAIGNGGRASVRRLVLDGSALTIQLDAALVHRHSLGTLNTLVGLLEVKARELAKPLSDRIEQIVSVKAIETRVDDARAALERARKDLRIACSVEIPGLGRVTHAACDVLG